MSKSNILEKFDELFSENKAPNIQNLESLIAETLQFFEYLRVKLQSSNADEKKEAMEMAQKLQQKLEDLAEKSLEASGMNRDQIFKMLSNPNNFTNQDWNSYKKAEQEITEYRKEALKQQPQKTASPKASKKTKGEWLKS